jgi:hypothetical protein
MRHLLLTLPLLLAACGSPPAAVGPVDAGGVTVTASLAVRDAAGRRLLADEPAPTTTAWTADKIDHAFVALYLEAGDTALVTLRYEQADIQDGKTARFEKLKHGTKYRIEATAYATSDETQPIHDVDLTKSTTPLETFEDPIATIDGGIRLVLRNKPFSGGASEGLDITPGGFETDADESMTW